MPVHFGEVTVIIEGYRQLLNDTETPFVAAIGSCRCPSENTATATQRTTRNLCDTTKHTTIIVLMIKLSFDLVSSSKEGTIRLRIISNYHCGFFTLHIKKVFIPCSFAVPCGPLAAVPLGPLRCLVLPGVACENDIIGVTAKNKIQSSIFPTTGDGK